MKYKSASLFMLPIFFAASYYFYYGVARDPNSNGGRDGIMTLDEFAKRTWVNVISDLTMNREEGGRTVIRGVITNQTPGYTLERLSVKISIKDDIHCDDDPDNPFSKYLPSECKGLRNADITRTLHEAVYQCYEGNLAFGETAECYTPIAYSFSRNSPTHWNFSVHSQFIRPDDPLGIFNHRRQ